MPGGAKACNLLKEARAPSSAQVGDKQTSYVTKGGLTEAEKAWTAVGDCSKKRRTEQSLVIVVGVW